MPTARSTGLTDWANYKALLWAALAVLVLTHQGLTAGQPVFREGRILVKPKPGRTAAVAALHAKEQARIIHRFMDLGGIEVLELPPGAGVLEMVEKYQKSGEVEFAEPDYIIHVAAAPNETAFEAGTLWHLNNLLYTGADIHAAAGWDATNSATNIIVAIVDSGIRYTHQDLASNMWVNPGEIAGNDLDDDGDGIKDNVYGINATNDRKVTGDPNDDFWHGTHVAGIVGAVGNNGLGACGIAWHVKLMACKFLDSTGSGTVDGAIACIEFARTNGAKVINASFGDNNYSAFLYTAITNCRAAGIIVVAAAGNSSANNDLLPFYPANFNSDNIITVTATSMDDSLSWYSSYGRTNVDLAAPGTDIYSTANTSDAGYRIDSGTSFATPCVAGAVALMRARFPSHTYQQIINRLLLTTDPLPGLYGLCVTGGRLNLDRALNHFPSTLTPTPDLAAGKIRLQLQGEPYQPYILQATTNLAAWNGLSTNTSPANGILLYTNSMSGEHRFYRALLNQ